MNKWQRDVEEFHRKFGLTVGETPKVRDANLRGMLIYEEAQETLKALPHHDMVGIVDGLCDLIYVCLGTAVAFGIDLDEFWDAVHKSNMAKEGGATRADGKLLKPEGWQPPDIAGILERMGVRR